MSGLVAFISIIAALGVGVVSPGPSFVFVARTAVALSRADGVAAAVGMGIGAILFAGLALVGLQAVLAEVTSLGIVLKLLGGAYLIYLAIRLWRGADVPIAALSTIAGRRGLLRSFALGLATQVSNPKAAIVYGGIFAALLPPVPPLWMMAALPPAILTLEVGWYAIVALAFSSERPRTAYLRSRRWIDRIAGAVVGALGVRLVVDGMGRSTS
jgi:threonine/homoserine/homoserine lactone efflux protein